MPKTLEDVKKELELTTTNLVGIQETHATLVSAVEADKAELTALEGADPKDADAIKAAKAKLKSSEGSVKASQKEIDKLTKAKDRLTVRVAAMEEKAEAQAKKVAEREAKKAEAAKAKAAREAARGPEQNGVRRPASTSKTGGVWDKADELSQKLGAPVPVADLLKALPETNEHTVKTQYARWRKFHGVTGRHVTPKPEAEAAEPEAKK